MSCSRPLTDSEDKRRGSSPRERNQSAPQLSAWLLWHCVSFSQRGAWKYKTGLIKFKKWTWHSPPEVFVDCLSERETEAENRLPLSTAVSGRAGEFLELILPHLSYHQLKAEPPPLRANSYKQKTGMRLIPVSVAFVTNVGSHSARRGSFWHLDPCNVKTYKGSGHLN